MTVKKSPPLRAAIDQFGTLHWFRTNNPRRALLEKVGRSRAEKMYQDGPDGKPRHTGYVVGAHWFSVFRCEEIGATIASR